MRHLDIGPVSEKGEIPIIEPFESVVAYVFQDQPKVKDPQAWEYAHLFVMAPAMKAAIGLVLDKLQEHDPQRGYTFAAVHGLTDLLNMLQVVYAATTIPELADKAQHRVACMLPDEDDE